jgi:hypothetical protein
MNLLPLSEPRCIGHTHGSSHMQPAQPCSCGCGRKEGGVACLAHCETCERRVNACAA